MLTRYVTYRHPQNPLVRFRELLKDVPKWAVDIKEEKEVIEMTDKELLELAAKAAGIKIKPMQVNNVTKQGDNQFIGYMTDIEQWPRGWFNPLTDDGDALRLAVKLHMCLDTFDVDEEEHTVAWKTLSNECRENHNGDPYAATRRAIVRAAAEIGKEMK